MDELRPCPFCGGEAHVVGKPHEAVFCVGCGDDTCLGFSGLGWLYGTEEEAAAAWNRRAERTCRIDMPVIDWETGETDYRCSFCGFSADPQDWAETYACCPRCGSRVVDADADR